MCIHCDYLWLFMNIFLDVELGRSGSSQLLDCVMFSSIPLVDLDLVICI